MDARACETGRGGRGIRMYLPQEASRGSGSEVATPDRNRGEAVCHFSIFWPIWRWENS